ncbi:hypothetical protein Clacol_004309 [Clathrus columnatus]|uniref:Fungal-type protein kinase domain-containing protein n=1 Tax=Clathrus columnatus TaxID=1419009 RepID=A0AAV5A9D7_9AGAM|nr:hypothetical protein Clacol_004309 [Clathrus columnatus]
MKEFNYPRPELSQHPPSTPSRSSNTSIPSGLLSTPMSFKQSGSGPFTSIDDKRNSRMAHMSNEVVDKIVGPMPVKIFLKKFLPKVSKDKPQMSLKSYQKKMEIVSKSQSEKDMYTPFVEAIKPLCPDFYIRDTHDLPFTAFHSIIIKPDICFYDVQKPTGDETRDIKRVEMMLEFKHREKYDPFCDAADKPLLISSTDARDTLGQITSYASAHQAAQFRSHVFSLLVLPHYARILRWDRSGVIVTERIPLSSCLLRNFFHRYCYITPEERGIDTTVTTLPPDSKIMAEEKIFKNQLLLNGSLYIVSHQLYMDDNRSPFGRSTRAFIAHSVSENTKVFVKDTWRLSSQTPEHELYKTLKENKVQYTATVLNAGDILAQQTRTQDFISRKWAKNPPRRLRKHFHYRLVLKEIGNPLTTFSSTKLLVTVVHQALIAHKEAYEKADILHRDISANNILIYKGQALLIDWDLSKNEKDPKQAREAERTGTWQFTAACLLSSKTVGPHTRTDDIESFIYVLTWVAFKYASHSMSKPLLTGFLRNVFDYAIADEDGSPDNGGQKARYLKEPDELRQANFASKNLLHLLLEITETISTRYRKPPAPENPLRQSWSNNKQDDSEAKALDEKMNALLSSDWIIDLFGRALELSGWPENDFAKEHELVRDLEPRMVTKSSQQPASKDGDEELVEMEEEGDRGHDDVDVDEMDDGVDDGVDDGDDDEDDDDDDEDENEETEPDEPPVKRLRLEKPSQ